MWHSAIPWWTEIYYRENSRMNKVEVSSAANRIKGMIAIRVASAS